jgi:hypothetical protein
LPHRADGRLGETRADETGFDHYDLDSESSHLEAQGVAYRLDGILARMVEASTGEGSLPPMDERLTILPKPCLRIPGNTSWHMRTRPNTFVSNWRLIFSIGTSSIAPDWL